MLDTQVSGTALSSIHLIADDFNPRGARIAALIVGENLSSTGLKSTGSASRLWILAKS